MLDWLLELLTDLVDEAEAGDTTAASDGTAHGGGEPLFGSRFDTDLMSPQGNPLGSDAAGNLSDEATGDPHRWTDPGVYRQGA